MGAQRLVDVVKDRDVLDVVEMASLQEVRLAQQGLHMLHAFLGQGNLPCLLVFLVIGFHQFGHQQVDGAVKLRGIVGRAGDDQRRARLVD